MLIQEFIFMKTKTIKLILFSLLSLLYYQEVYANMREKIIAIEDAQDPATSTLKLVAADVKFPLSQEDKELIAVMQELCFSLDGVGIAAPQLNISKKIAVIYIPKSASLMRDNVVEYPIHVIINARYEPIENEGKYEDFEGCYSVRNVYGKVPRYNAIKVTYQNEEGEEISKIVTGFYARVLQHEIDHLNGLLITDRLTPDCIQGTVAEMLELRRQSLPEEKRRLFDELIKQKSIVKGKK